jgi:hypothetical protein
MKAKKELYHAGYVEGGGRKKKIYADKRNEGVI